MLKPTLNKQIEINDPSPVPTGKGAPKSPKKIKVHKVLLLDPAVGTATFPYAIVDHIRGDFMRSGNAGLWSGYVREHLLPRLFGFELLMAPYAVAHFKLGLQLAGLDLPDGLRSAWAYDFAQSERIGIYLTNTLEGPHEHTGLPLFTQFLARETDAANRVKQDLPVLVILGNPPYSGHSANKGPWIDDLLKGKLANGSRVASYYEVDGQPLGERNPKWLQDDYVKFIRWAQWRIERTGAGILAFITNHSYLDNPTFRGMRRALMQTFTDIYVLDLHGNAKKREVAPDGGKDENVFDIQQGVAIGIFVKEPGKQGPARVHHAELWGTREAKYAQLLADDVQTTPWRTLAPQAPFYLFVPQNVDLLAEYEQGWKVTEIFPVNSVGIVTSRDGFVFDHNEASLVKRVQTFLDPALTDDQARERFLRPGDQLPVAEVRKQLRARNWQQAITSCLYRPFDVRSLLYDPKVIERSRKEVMGHLLDGENLGLVIPRRVELTGSWTHALATNHVIDHVVVSLKTIDSLLPLYIFPVVEKETAKQGSWLQTASWPPDINGRVPNLAPAYVAEVEARLGLRFIRNLTPQPPSLEGKGESDARILPTASPLLPGEGPGERFSPEDLFGYIYAVLHAPAYRSRYAEFLKGDFPRVPIPSAPALFWRLAALGRELVALHLLDADAAPGLLKPVTRFPISGDGLVEKGHSRYDEANQRVYISADNVKVGKHGQYFEGLPPEVWSFRVGGYQPCQKWLKDRVGRKLTYDDLTHYQRIVVALKETIRLMAEIDETIPAWPIR